jgi:hypothetical protein
MLIDDRGWNTRRSQYELTTNFATGADFLDCSNTGPFLEWLKNTPIFLPSVSRLDKFGIQYPFYTYYRALLTRLQLKDHNSSYL